ncbi:MAG: hypothetical protein MPJ22_05015, partial [Pirellulales bacterium]|nr:hypothetical protein [Pirellulales bacterium]
HPGTRRPDPAIRRPAKKRNAVAVRAGGVGGMRALKQQFCGGVGSEDSMAVKYVHPIDRQCGHLRENPRQNRRQRQNSQPVA